MNWAMVNAIVSGLGFLVVILTVFISIGGLRQMLVQHAATLVEHGQRMDTHDRTMLTVVGDLQRVIGRVEYAQAHQKP